MLWPMSNIGEDYCLWTLVTSHDQLCSIPPADSHQWSVTNQRGADFLSYRHCTLLHWPCSVINNNHANTWPARDHRPFKLSKQVWESGVFTEARHQILDWNLLWLLFTGFYQDFCGIWREVDSRLVTRWGGETVVCGWSCDMGTPCDTAPGHHWLCSAGDNKCSPQQIFAPQSVLSRNVYWLLFSTVQQLSIFIRWEETFHCWSKYFCCGDHEVTPGVLTEQQCWHQSPELLTNCDQCLQGDNDHNDNHTHRSHLPLIQQ